MIEVTKINGVKVLINPDLLELAEETPDTVCSQWRPSPTGSDEQATILLKNASGQMAAVALSMHAKQPKRAMISGEKGYIEIMEFPRAAGAVIVDAETGRGETV